MGSAVPLSMDVVVDPTYQGKGIGRRWMEVILEQLPKRSIMLVSTHGNEQFYRKLGFHRLRTAYILQDDFRAWEAGGYVEHEAILFSEHTK